MYLKDDRRGVSASTIAHKHQQQIMAQPIRRSRQVQSFQIDVPLSVAAQDQRPAVVELIHLHHAVKSVDHFHPRRGRTVAQSLRGVFVDLLVFAQQAGSKRTVQYGLGLIGFSACRRRYELASTYSCPSF